MEEEENDQEQESPLKRNKREPQLAQEGIAAREEEEKLTFEESGPQPKKVEKTMEERMIPTQRKRRRKITVSPSDFTEDSDSETIAQVIEKRRKITVLATSSFEDPIHEVVEQEYPKAIVVLERAEERQQQQFLGTSKFLHAFILFLSNLQD